MLSLETLSHIQNLQIPNSVAFMTLLNFLQNNAYRQLLTAPVTDAKDERSFSRLKLIKTYLRTTMNNNRLEALLLLSYGKDLTDSVNISKVAKLWVQLKVKAYSTPVRDV